MRKLSWVLASIAFCHIAAAQRLASTPKAAELSAAGEDTVHPYDYIGRK
ncbi:MAG TPA: hypothetical protein VEH30_14840 [Terriglobales bacterium]|nr:hypothetical protein [Terriglobales bacterium]